MPENRITHIGKYDVVKTIGRGGMGVVYKATDPLLGRMVAIKMMSGTYADDPDLLKRFYREARSTASLRHPNIVTVYDVGDQEGKPYLVMEFLDGESLDRIISSRRELSLLEKISYMVQVCRGLQYAHERNIVHRDVKPANIMVLREGSTKIVDFGIARMGDEHVTQPGQVMGSIHYMSPEQISDRPIDARADLFATGIVLYELLTYRLPFRGEDSRATLFKIIHDAPPPLSEYLKSYPPDLDGIIERALAKDCGDRYQSADEMAFDLTQVQLQLKSGLVAELLDKANVSMEKGDLTDARERLVELLKIDPQNQSANDRMRVLQKSVQQRRRAEQLQQLRKEAEEAAKQQQFDKALRIIEHAISVDQTNPELQSIREELGRAKAKADFIKDCMSRALSARNANDLNQALRFVDELLRKEPQHSPALALRDEISREIAHREKQRKIQELMEKAHRQIATRQFTEALQSLDSVAELDPNVSNLRGLVNLANEGIEQDRRRQLQVLTFEIDRLMEGDNYAAALARIDNGLQTFPGEPTLVRLKEVSEERRAHAEYRANVDRQIASARSMLSSGKANDAIAALQVASDLIDKVPTEARARFNDLRVAIAHCRNEAEKMLIGPETTALGSWESTRTTLASSSDATTREMGAGSNTPSRRPVPANEKTLLELTPPEGQAAMPPRSEAGDPDLATRIVPPPPPPANTVIRNPTEVPTSTTTMTSLTNVPGWQADVLVKVEKQLAVFLGPLARVLVKKAACKTADIDELYKALSTHLERESEKRAFLANKKSALAQSPTSSQTQRQPTMTMATPPPASPSSIELTSTEIDRASHLLARHLGPIANVLVKRAARRSGTSLRTLYSLLAEHLDNETERRRFLRDSGFPDL